MRESEFKRRFRELYKGWSTAVEPGVGCDTGIADVFVACGPYGVIIPVELKWHEIIRGRICPTKVRPEQIQWHRNLRKHSWCSLLVTSDKDLETFYVIDSALMPDWKWGYEIGIEAIPIFPTDVGMNLEISRFLKRHETPIGED